MTTFLFLHALVGFCGTMPSVEFFKFFRELLKNYVPPSEPVPGPKEGNGTPEPDIYWRYGAGLLGGVLGAVLVKDSLSEPLYTLAGAYAGGRFLSEAVSLVRFSVPSYKRK
jgi:hypothetical protein